ncbi:MAG: AMP-binding protein [bacterium]
MGVAPISLDSLRSPSARGPAPAGRTVHRLLQLGIHGPAKGILGRPGAIAHFIAWEQALLGAGAGSAGERWRRRRSTPPCATRSCPCRWGAQCACPPDRPAPWPSPPGNGLAGGRRVEVVHTVPTVAGGLLALPGLALPDLRALAGEAATPRRRWPLLHRRPGAALYNLYEPTETTMIKLCHRVTADAGRSASPGRPLPGTEVRSSIRWPARAPGRPGEVVLRRIAPGRHLEPEPTGTPDATARRTPMARRPDG